MNGDVESIGITGFGEQLFCAFGVVRICFESRNVAEQRFGHQLSRWDGLLLHHAIGDCRPVDRLRDRAAHAQVGQRIFVERLAILRGDERTYTLEMFEVEIDHAMRDLRGHGELRIGLEARQIGDRRLLDRVDVAR